jgi:AAA domain
MFGVIPWLIELWRAFQALVGKGVAEVIATVVLLVFGFLFNKLWQATKHIILYLRMVKRARRDVARRGGNSWPQEGRGLWVARPILRPKIRNYDPHIPPAKVLLVANAKGGVGKTTVAANLGARLSEIADYEDKKPVLLIDLDFQGSLSSMSIVGQRNWLPPKGQDSKATYLLSGDISPATLAVWDRGATFKANGNTLQAPKLKIVTAYYDLAQAENRLLIEWLLDPVRDCNDIRFRLYSILQKLRS